jgi:cholesterol oxidase
MKRSCSSNSCFELGDDDRSTSVRKAAAERGRALRSSYGNPLTDVAELQWGEEQSAPAVKSAKFVMDKINAANLTGYKDGVFDGKDFLDNTTYHPVGGIPLGDATDAYGRVKGYDKLYVSDSSLIPRGIVANPALTVAALTERNIERIIAEDFKL